MNGRLPHPVPYQGSKRALANRILEYFPADVQTLYEPFAGSAAVSIAASHRKRASSFVLNDLNAPLMALWEEIINYPASISSAYERLWKSQIGNEREFYDEVREKFNATKKPDFLLYLLARCVKASVRYNSSGDFNQSPDNRRLGRNPEMMKMDIFGASKLLGGRTSIFAEDYTAIAKRAEVQDLVYMDPPYQGTSGNRDGRYIRGLQFEHLVETLEALNQTDISFILSYDGSCGSVAYGEPLPKSLSLSHVIVNAGRSTQSTLLGRDDVTFESLYLSPALVKRIGLRAHLLDGILQKAHRSQVAFEFA